MKRMSIQRRTPLKRGRVYVRNGEMLACVTCGVEFYAGPSEVRRGRKYCSQKCMGANWRTQRNCTVCGVTFESRGPRKTCSRPCWNEANRQSKIGKGNPNYVNGITAARNAWWASVETHCHQCGIGASRLHVHHVVYAQHVRRAGGDEFDPRNGLTLCFGCHMGHHHGADDRLPMGILRPENLEFAHELLGAATQDYFARYYRAGDVDDGLGWLIDPGPEEDR